MDESVIDLVAQAIFKGCQSFGIEEIWASERWPEASEGTRSMYREIAERVLNEIMSQ